MNRSSYLSRFTKESLRSRQSNRISDFEETQYSLLQDCDNHSEDGYPLQSQRCEQFVEKELEPGDTLLSLSLQFNCPVSELKRINNIHRDNEIFAHRTVKVPVKPGSILTELIAGVHVSGGLCKEEDKPLIDFNVSLSSPSLSDEDNDLFNSSSVVDIERNKPKHFSSPSLPIQEIGEHTLNTGTSISRVLTTNSVPNTDSCVQELENQSSECNETSLSSPLLQQEVSHLIKKPTPIYKCSGADWGLTWPQLLICSLLLGFAGPILYVLYVTDKQRSGGEISSG